MKAISYPVPASDRVIARRTLLELRHQLSAAEREAAERAIVTTIETWLSQSDHSGGVLGVYWAIRGEPQLLAACRQWLAAGRELALPRVTADDAPLAFGRWRVGSVMREGRLRVPEPVDFEPVTPSRLLVPCLGFDARAYRLGYGGGFYDRTLAVLGPLPTLGVAFAHAQVSGFEAQAHDRPLDAIATETGLLVAP